MRAVWYNNQRFGGTRDEARLTNFGGAQSPLLESANTGALVLFAFFRANAAVSCRVWICGSVEEEERAEAYIGPVEPGLGVTWAAARGSLEADRPARIGETCRLAPDQIPDAWLRSFPSGVEIVQKTLELLAKKQWSPDKRLLRRRSCEYEVFLSVEEAMILPIIAEGFDTVGEFVSQAQTVLQRRKARSGRSLELQVKQILMEEGLVEGRDFQHGVESDPGRRPDFLFPSQSAYRDSGFPIDRLMMLATKTTCRDRWRQVCNEADRIKTKHLLTLQEGVTQEQYAEMKASGVQLVVPRPLHNRYPESVRPHIIGVSDFLAELDTIKKLS